jgi:hypothetical protein
MTKDHDLFPSLEVIVVFKGMILSQPIVTAQVGLFPIACKQKLEYN